MEIFNPTIFRGTTHMQVWEKILIASATVLLSLYILSWIPWLVFACRAETAKKFKEIPSVDAALVFGGLHQGEEMLSETNRERLLTAVVLKKKQLIKTIVISNTQQAAFIMKEFLLANSIPAESIEIDTTAIVTEDTCVTEAARHPQRRSVVFVSHGYHLPRILFACRKWNVQGVGIPAEEFGKVERTPLSWHRVAFIRFQRYQREAHLALAGWLGFYSPRVSHYGEHRLF